MPFNTDADRTEHWQRHHTEFEPPPCTEAIYEALGEAFLAGPMTPMVLECTRANGRRCRYDPDTNEYGVVAADGCVLTYFKPDLSMHPYSTNEDYFHARC